jgi:divalent metal cation (Fe/Co/Zn/Cd) transporter
MALVVVLGWNWADIAAALVITVLIGRAAWQVLSQAGRVLVDAAPYDPAQLAAWVQEVPAIERVLRVRSRGTSDAAYIDVDVQVQPETTTAQADAIAGAVRDRLAAHVDFAEVEVHFAPHYTGEPNYAQVARARADALGLGTHEVRVTEGPAGRVLEMHVEVPPGQTLDAAHAQVSQLEHDVQLNLPDVAEVVTHIEPAQAEPTGGDHDTDAARTADRLAGQALGLLRQHYGDMAWHDLRVYPDDGGFAAVLHVALPPQITVEAAHRVAEDAETLLRTRLPGLARVTIHTEPPDDLTPGPA